MTAAEAWRLVCPECRGGLTALGPERMRCQDCRLEFPRLGGVWRFLSPAREAAFSGFLSDYTKIRKAEGRGSDNPDHYRRLPDCDPKHPIAWQWEIRRKTYDCLQRNVLPRLGTSLRILDLGAGVGWLSHRLLGLGHRPCSVELSIDERDGLGAARHFEPSWPLLQAEFDRLPLPDGVADVAIYNASLHYSVDYATTLREALRVLRQDGWVVVLETPIYRREESGRQMSRERHLSFEKQHGTRSDALPSLEFLTWGQLDALGRELNLRWKKAHPWYGLRWALRPWKARLSGAREPSRFVILAARKRRA